MVTFNYNKFGVYLEVNRLSNIENNYFEEKYIIDIIIYLILDSKISIILLFLFFWHLSHRYTYYIIYCNFKIDLCYCIIFK